MITRRACLVGGTAAAMTPMVTAAKEDDPPEFDPGSPLPHKSAFFPIEGTYLNSASRHPLSRGARRAINRYLDFKTYATESDFSNFQVYQNALQNYAILINASTEEICFVQSTTVGENLILMALGIPERKTRIVTDELHFVGSLPTYGELSKLGVNVVTIRASADGSIDIDKFEAAINADTRLVSVSLVSSTNGYEHDLKRLCDIAHAKGAYVYADIIHAVGSSTFDVRESGVDFCSSASYKWLMGELGLGFMYVRADRLSEINRPWFGHYQLARRKSLCFPNPNAGDRVTDYEHHNSALGHFALGSQANIVAAQLDYSLKYLLETGVDRIQSYRQPLIDRMQEEIPKLGYSPITPRNSRTALVSFRHNGNAEALHNKMASEKIAITVAAHHFRVSPSVFNDMDDIDRLLRALS